MLVDRLPSEVLEVVVAMSLVVRLRFVEVEVVADPTLLVKAERVQDLHFRALPTHVELRDNDQKKLYRLDGLVHLAFGANEQVNT